MRVLLKIPELWVHTASHTEDEGKFTEKMLNEILKQVPIDALGPACGAVVDIS
jgi:hypothetical protein